MLQRMDLMYAMLVLMVLNVMWNLPILERRGTRQTAAWRSGSRSIMDNKRGIVSVFVSTGGGPQPVLNGRQRNALAQQRTLSLLRERLRIKKRSDFLETH